MQNSRWCKWSERHSILNKKDPGVYFIAYTQSELSGKPFELSEDIVYIGVNNSKKGVIDRLHQFSYAMKNVEKWRVHGGAERVRMKYKDHNTFFNQAFISVCTFKVSDANSVSQILRIKGACLKHECDSLAEYYELFGRLPEFNDPNSKKKEK